MTVGHQDHVLTPRGLWGQPTPRAVTRTKAPAQGVAAPFLSVSVACTSRISPDPPRTSGPSSPCKDKAKEGMQQNSAIRVQSGIPRWNKTTKPWHCRDPGPHCPRPPLPGSSMTEHRGYSALQRQDGPELIWEVDGPGSRPDTRAHCAGSQWG